MEDQIYKLPPFKINEIAKIRTRSVRPLSWGVDALRVKEVWPKSKGKGVIAFIVDTEDDTKHPAVSGNHQARYSQRFTDEPINVVSLGGHGQHVADTVLQMAPDTVIAFVKVLSNQGSGYSTWIASGIRHVADVELLPTHQGYKKVINMSLGSNSPSPVIKAALKYATQKGVLVFAAAGNDGRDVDYPGAFDEYVTAIGAVDEDLNPASFSSPGPSVDLAGPGVKIWAAWRNNEYASLSGTSMATPHEVGIAALLISNNIPIRGLIDVMVLNATDVHEPGKDEKTGYGITVAPDYFGDVITDPEPEPKPVKPIPIYVYVIGGLVVLGVILYFALK